jgi:hypothetical protein
MTFASGSLDVIQVSSVAPELIHAARIGKHFFPLNIFPEKSFNKKKIRGRPYIRIINRGYEQWRGY